MQHLDAMRAASGQVGTKPEFCAVTVRLNGSSDLQLTVNVRELREALGLPPYSLLTEGIFSSFVPPPEPADDVEGEDHLRE